MHHQHKNHRIQPVSTNCRELQQWLKANLVTSFFKNFKKSSKNLKFSNQTSSNLQKNLLQLFIQSFITQTQKSRLFLTYQKKIKTIINTKTKSTIKKLYSNNLFNSTYPFSQTPIQNLFWKKKYSSISLSFPKPNKRYISKKFSNILKNFHNQAYPNHALMQFHHIYVWEKIQMLIFRVLSRTNSRQNSSSRREHDSMTLKTKPSTISIIQATHAIALNAQMIRKHFFREPSDLEFNNYGHLTVNFSFWPNLKDAFRFYPWFLHSCSQCNHVFLYISNPQCNHFFYK